MASRGCDGWLKVVEPNSNVWGWMIMAGNGWCRPTHLVWPRLSLMTPRLEAAGWTRRSPTMSASGAEFHVTSRRADSARPACIMSQSEAPWSLCLLWSPSNTIFLEPLGRFLLFACCTNTHITDARERGEIYISPTVLQVVRAARLQSLSRKDWAPCHRTPACGVYAGPER